MCVVVCIFLLWCFDFKCGEFVLIIVYINLEFLFCFLGFMFYGVVLVFILLWEVLKIIECFMIWFGLLLCYYCVLICILVEYDEICVVVSIDC